jgi:hypothetical protein
MSQMAFINLSVAYHDRSMALCVAVKAGSREMTHAG